MRSNVYGLTKLGADVSVGGPTTLMPTREWKDWSEKSI